MKYTDFAACSAQFANIEAIDYFFAREMLQRGGDTLPTGSDEAIFCLLLALSAAQRAGNSCLSLTDIAETRWFEHAGQPDTGWQFGALDTLIQQATALSAAAPLNNKLILQDTRLYTARYWQFEQELVTQISQRCQPLTLTDRQQQQLKDVWPVLFSTVQSNTQEQDWQQVAVALCINRPFAMLSGGPGTGKTYTIARLLMALQVAWQGELSIVLTAPTGKAAQRLSESMDAALVQFSRSPALASYTAQLSQPAMTLHRLLGMPRWGINSRHSASNTIAADVIVVDESSMIDLALMTRLFRALAPHTRVILVGDPRQLPSVEAGNVLGDIIAAFGRSAQSGVDESTAAQLATLCPHLPALTRHTQQHPTPLVHFELKRAQRFGGQLAAVAAAINSGVVDGLWQQLGSADARQKDALNGVAQCAFNTIDAQFNAIVRDWFGGIAGAATLAEAMAQLQSVRWLTPFRQGEYGSEQLNSRIERLLTPGAAQRGIYRGRPVMITENHHGQRLYNGDVGLIWPDEQGVLKAWFAGAEHQYRSVPLMRLPRHETVYAMTIHKSQGSEFNRLMLLLPQAPSYHAAGIYTRELIYTGLTRAKEGALLVTSETILQQAVKHQQQRKTGLAERLRQAFE
ncbi:exodeoxyribonuclease V subunit alpha [Alteromonas gilva]|uniref:RecBCD enzyme subunit RecD n=1 Tax=Alteromonas gilva TaxID=2987522 RepID=A0ABT5L4D3_9ALTE|nr:exodeoxyribonuclease V subunit alpha [Alteromonas gilva]MDC8830722.1 exodeoxyribonuclease V subunit alpha [Alteromonas gilva]